MKAALLLVALLTAVVVLAGCGHSDKKANEAYATSVCTAISGWKSQVTTIATDFSGGISKQVLDDKAQQLQSATTDLAKQIKAVPAPDTDEGKAAQTQIEALSSDVQTTTEAVKAVVNQLGSDTSAANITAAVITVAPQVKNLASTAKSTVSALKDASGGLADAFKKSDACKSLT